MDVVYKENLFKKYQLLHDYILKDIFLIILQHYINSGDCLNCGSWDIRGHSIFQFDEDNYYSDYAVWYCNHCGIEL